jgi:hypothetical protein
MLFAAAPSQAQPARVGVAVRRARCGLRRRGWTSSRRATRRPAFQPGARPPIGGTIASASRPARATSQATIEFEFHISPACNSSRPQTGVGTDGTCASSRCARCGSSLSRRGLSTASPTSAMTPSRQRRSSYRKIRRRPAQRLPTAPSPTTPRSAPSPAPSAPARSRTVRPAPAPRAPSDRGRRRVVARAAQPPPRRCARSGEPSGRRRRAAASKGRSTPANGCPHHRQVDPAS